MCLLKRVTCECVGISLCVLLGALSTCWAITRILDLTTNANSLMLSRGYLGTSAHAFIATYSHERVISSLAVCIPGGTKHKSSRIACQVLQCAQMLLISSLLQEHASY